MKTQGNCQKGFSMIEMLVAITILSVGILGVASMQLNSIGGNDTAREITDVTTKAALEIEQVMAQSYTSIVSSGPTTDGDGFEITQTVTNNSPFTNTLTVKIKVSRRGKSATLTSVVPQII